MTNLKDRDPTPPEGIDDDVYILYLIHISEPTRRSYISYAVFCLKKSLSYSFSWNCPFVI